MRRNTAGQHVAAQMVSATDGSPVTSSVSVVVSKDGGAQAASSGTLTHRGSGHFDYAPTQAETDADHVVFQFSGGGSVPVLVQVYTSHPQSGDAYARLGAPAGASVSADVAAVKAQTAAIELDTQDIQAKIGAPAGASLAADIATRAATGEAAAALAAYDPPTHAELVAEIDDVQADIAGLNDVSTAEVRAQVDAALIAYDPPTAAELASAAATIQQDVADVGLGVDGVQATADAIQEDTEDIQGRLPAALVGGQIDASVGAVQAGAITAAGFAAGAVDAAALATDAVNEIRDAILAAQVDGLTVQQIVGVIAAVLVATLSGADTNVIKIRNLQDTLDRVTMPVDEHGNRGPATLDLTGL